MAFFCGATRDIDAEADADATKFTHLNYVESHVHAAVYANRAQAQENQHDPHAKHDVVMLRALHKHICSLQLTDAELIWKYASKQRTDTAQQTRHHPPE